MRTIFKYTIGGAYSGFTPITMPAEAKILSAQLQHGEIQIWAEVDSDNPPKIYTIEIVGTGCAMVPHMRQFIGTVQKDGEVWHIYWLPAV